MNGANPAMYEELVVNNRTTAQKLARSLLRRWACHMDMDEVTSIADLALCEAARRFDPTRNIQFITFLFHFVRGGLVAEIRRCRASSATIFESDLRSSAERSGTESDNRDHGAVLSAMSSETPTESVENPERAFYLGELRSLCKEAMNELNELERTALINIHVLDEKVARLARRVGYSRGHLSMVRTNAIRKIRPMFARAAA
jgi:RNA polymerase sigma factor (sigma-70 family)